MRITIVGAGDLASNPRVVALARQLDAAGNSTTIVCGGRSDPSDGDRIVRIAGRIPGGWGAMGRTARRIQPKPLRIRNYHSRLVSAVVDTAPQLIYAVDEVGVQLATRAAPAAGAAVVRPPDLPDAGPYDIVGLAPSDPTLSSSPAGQGSSNHTVRGDRVPPSPIPGRWTGMRVTLAYRRTPTTPARFLEAALVRAGIHIDTTDEPDFDRLPADTDFVVIVESPLPALDARGRPDVPVLFWAHHGEHHTPMQLRILERYHVDAVLLAHSWHLAHRFPVPVHRFPFAMAPELLDGSRPWRDREVMAAFVGRAPAGEPIYRERRELLDRIAGRLGVERVCFVDGVSPERLAAIYSDTRVVVNEGGTRHHPITMRVFEAIGSGALLATTPTPGLDCLLASGDDFVEIDIESGAERVESLANSIEGERIAMNGFATVRQRHTYDHRVDELVEIAASTIHRTDRRLPPAGDSKPAQLVDRHPDIGSVAVYGASELCAELPLRSAWADPPPGERRYDAVVMIDPGASDTIAAIEQAVRYIFVANDHSEDLHTWLATRSDRVGISEDAGMIVVDLRAPGYRIAPEDAGG